MKVSHSVNGSNFTALLVQNRPERSLTKNLKQVETLLSEVRLEQTDLIVFPEFIFGGRKSEKWLAETSSFFKVFCRKNLVNVVLGSMPEEENGKWYNTSFLIDRMGELTGKYRKMHLGMYEGEFTAGHEIGLFSVDGVKVGLGICWDLWFPEYWRILKKRGATLFAVPACADKRGWNAFLSMARARAVENQTFLVPCNSLRFGIGKSCVIKYDASIMATLNDKLGALLVNLNLAQAEKWKDKIGYKRRTDIYEIIEKSTKF
jgi:omega-amidase